MARVSPERVHSLRATLGLPLPGGDEWLFPYLTNAELSRIVNIPGVTFVDDDIALEWSDTVLHAAMVRAIDKHLVPGGRRARALGVMWCRLQELRRGTGRSLPDLPGDTEGHSGNRRLLFNSDATFVRMCVQLGLLRDPALSTIAYGVVLGLQLAFRLLRFSYPMLIVQRAAQASDAQH